MYIIIFYLKFLTDNALQSPQGTSPCTLSPSLSLRSRPLGRFPFGPSSPQENRVPSPHSNIHSQVSLQFFIFLFW